MCECPDDMPLSSIPLTGAKGADGGVRIASSRQVPVRAVSLFTANGLKSRPSRPGDAPSDLKPKLRLVLDGLSNRRVPRRSWLPSIANSRSSTRIPVPEPLSGLQPEPVAAVWSLLPHELDPSW